MNILKQKALATQMQYGHSNTDIRSLVLQELIRLNKDYRSVPDKKGIMAKYSSTPYKLFMKNSASEDDFDWKQVEKCLLDETNINKFLKKDSDYIHPKTKDFFAIYCGIEGYNSFLSESRNKNSVVSDEKQNNRLRKELNSIPHIELDNYLPRVEIIEDIFALFQRGNKKVNINGISGVGKTFLAKHFIQHYSENYSHIVWLNCSVGFVKAFSSGNAVELLDRIGLTSQFQSCIEGNLSEEDIMRLALSRLADLKENSILILDNMDEEVYSYENVIDMEGWNILATSQETLEGFFNLTAPSFDNEAVDLFYKYYKVQRDDDNLARLLSAIGYHTLTVELLAKTSQKSQLKITELVNRFIEKGINVVEKAKVISDHSNERETKIENIEIYLNIVFDTSSLDEEKCKILLNIALLQTDSITIELFEEVYLNNTAETEIIDVFNYNLSILSDKGWVQIQNDRIRIHGLVNSIVIKRFLDRKDFLSTTTDYLGKILNTTTKDPLLQIDYLAMAEHLLESFTDVNEKTIYLKKAMSVLYATTGFYEKAKKIWSELEETENIYESIAMFHNLAVIAMNQEKIEEALHYSNLVHSLFDDKEREELCSTICSELDTFLKDTLIEKTADFENNSTLKMVVQLMDMILNCHSIINHYDIGKSRLEKIGTQKQIIVNQDRVLSLFEKNVSPDLIFSIGVYREYFLRKDANLRNIAGHYIALGSYEIAEEILKANLEIKETKLIEERFDLFHNYRFIIELYIRWKKYEEAKFYFEKNRIFCDTLTQNHPFTASLEYDNNNLQKLALEKGIIPR